jgi:hypothetical protein
VPRGATFEVNRLSKELSKLVNGETKGDGQVVDKISKKAIRFVSLEILVESLKVAATENQNGQSCIVLIIDILGAFLGVLDIFRRR